MNRATPPHAHRSRELSPGERFVDFAVHICAIIAGLIAFPFLFTRVASRGLWGDVPPMAVYAAGFFMMFGFSCAYNFAKPSNAKWRLRQCDLAAIFVMIAGTYTALLSQIPVSAWSLGLLGLVWGVALAGAATRLFWPGRFERGAVLFYLGLGWAALPMARPLAQALPVESSALIAAGGALYSIGVAFHVWESLKFHSAIWHVFVASAAGCQFLGVLAAIGRP